MLDKLLKAFGLLKKDVTALQDTVAKLEKVHPIVKEGKPGKDGKRRGLLVNKTEI